MVQLPDSHLRDEVALGHAIVTLPDTPTPSEEATGFSCIDLKASGGIFFHTYLLCIRHVLLDTMGRQKTLWIDEECWEKLERMEGDSVSDKVRRCIKSHDVATGALEAALRRQIETLKVEVEELKARRMRRTML